MSELFWLMSQFHFRHAQRDKEITGTKITHEVCLYTIASKATRRRRISGRADEPVQGQACPSYVHAQAAGACIHSKKKKKKRKKEKGKHVCACF